MSLQCSMAKGHGGPRVWYDRHRKSKSRMYHLFSVRRMVFAEGALWVVIVGPLCIYFGFKPRKGARP